MLIHIHVHILNFQPLLSFLTAAAELLSGHLLQISYEGNRSYSASRPRIDWLFEEVLPALYAGGFRPRAVDLRAFSHGYREPLEMLIRHPLLRQAPVLTIPPRPHYYSNGYPSSLVTEIVDWLHDPLPDEVFLPEGWTRERFIPTLEIDGQMANLLETV